MRIPERGAFQGLKKDTSSQSLKPMAEIRPIQKKWLRLEVHKE
jgi:hypothetical protein